jgi:hypothetical protein
MIAHAINAIDRYDFLGFTPLHLRVTKSIPLNSGLSTCVGPPNAPDQKRAGIYA